MRYVKMILRLILAFTWELPQTIIALFILLGLKIGGKNPDVTFNSYYWAFHIRQNCDYFGVGLSCFFTFNVSNVMLGNVFEQTVKHEAGHTIQSAILGWLFIPLVALPSVTFNILTRLNLVSYDKYYFRIWEKTASILGISSLGVKK